ncbi:MAG: CheR family methyltransferase [Pseudomonadota bacterium]
METASAIEALEIDLLLEALYQCHGFDFRNFERAPLVRRLHGVLRQAGLTTISALQDRVLHDARSCAALLRTLSVAPARLFDEPEQARLQRIVLGSCLRASPLPRVWLAECAGAQEAWSLAILLAEEKLHPHTEIFATVANPELLCEASAATMSMAALDACQQNYRDSGGAGELLDYFCVEDDRASLLPALRSKIVWAQYNLSTDASFNEFQLIMCRRALPDFGPLLRRRVLQLFHDSLSLFGVLAIDRLFGAGETLGHCYQPVFASEPWYKRIA